MMRFDFAQRTYVSSTLYSKLRIPYEPIYYAFNGLFYGRDRAGSTSISSGTLGKSGAADCGGDDGAD